MTCVSYFKFKLKLDYHAVVVRLIFFMPQESSFDISTFPVSMNLRRVLILGKKSLFRRLLLCYGHVILRFMAPAYSGLNIKRTF